MTVLNYASLLPKGLYADNAIAHIKIELFNECDYIREAQCSKKFEKLVSDDAAFVVPHVYDNISSKHILISDYIEGVPLDKCVDYDQETRNHVLQI
jgi:aarF domain-containing kinase